jgi:hypothetical protein
MKRHLTNLSRAFIATTLIMAASFAAVAQQVWEQQVRVLDIPKAVYTLSSGADRDFNMCTGPGNTVNLQVRSNQIILAIGTETATVDFSGTGNLSFTFQIKAGLVGSTLQALPNESDYEALGFPTSSGIYSGIVSWDNTKKTLTYPVTVIPGGTININMAMPNVTTGTVYRIEFVSVQSEIVSSCQTTLLNPTSDHYAEITVRPTPNVVYATGGSATSTFSVCEDDAFNVTVSDKLLVITEPTAGNTHTFTFTGDATTADPLLVAYTFTKNNVSAEGSLIGLPNSPVPISPIPGSQSETVYAPAYGEYVLTITAVSSFGCTATTFTPTPALTITSWSRPTIALSTNEICQGESVNILVDNTDGVPQLNMTLDYSVTPPNAGLPTTAVPITSTSTPIVAGDPGTFVFDLVSLVDARGCTAKPTTATVKVNPLPTVSFPTDDICKGGTMILTFKGVENTTNPEFVLEYRYSYNGGSPLIDPRNPEDPGLPSTFNTTTGLTYVSTESNGVANYTQNVTTGKDGIFKFYLHTISDGTCTNTVPDAVAIAGGWKWWLP